MKKLDNILEQFDQLDKISLSKLDFISLLKSTRDYQPDDLEISHAVSLLNIGIVDISNIWEESSKLEEGMKIKNLTVNQVLNIIM